MSWRWTIWSVGLAVLAAVLLTPLRVVLPASDLQRFGLSARQVAGSIWRGRIGDLMLGRQLLGTFDVRLEPAALLLGRIAMPFARLGSEQGPLTGVLRTGGALNGVERVNGRLAAGNLLGAAPIDSLEFTDATALFRRSACEKASGRVAARLAIRLGLIDLNRAFVGPLTCDGERVRARLASAEGPERIEFFIGANGRVRGWITVPASGIGSAPLLSAYGFRRSPDGLSLPFETRL